MKKILPFLLLFTACSTYVRSPGSRMLSPEAQGKLGSGSLEARVQSLKEYKMDFSGSSTKVPFTEDQAVHTFGGLGEMGIVDPIDVFAIVAVGSPFLIGGKLQFLGERRTTAKRGNFSASAAVAIGSRSTSWTENNGDVDWTGDDVKKAKTEFTHGDAGLYVGYRWLDSLLHYANAIYYSEEMSGKVTNRDETLKDAKFKYKNYGAIYSTGFIYYYKALQLKLDYSYMSSDWTYNRSEYINTVNGAIGFNF